MKTKFAIFAYTGAVMLSLFGIVVAVLDGVDWWEFDSALQSGGMTARGNRVHLLNLVHYWHGPFMLLLGGFIAVAVHQIRRNP